DPWKRSVERVAHATAKSRVPIVTAATATADRSCTRAARATLGIARRAGPSGAERTRSARHHPPSGPCRRCGQARVPHVEPARPGAACPQRLEERSFIRPLRRVRVLHSAHRAYQARIIFFGPDPERARRARATAPRLPDPI